MSIRSISSRRREVLLVCIVVLGTVVTGCNARKPWESTNPATGTIQFKGKPLANADISLYPIDPTFPETVRPRARSAAGGKFSLWTYKEGDGVPAGKYKATVIHNEVAVSKDTVVAKPNDLPIKYSRKDSTDLEVTINAGNNDVVLELK